MIGRAAFTMIELIFVIVIMGVLAAVAIPRLYATRTDAEIAKVNQNIGIALEEISNHSNIQDKVEDDLVNMSQAIKMMIDQGYASKDPSDSKIVYIKVGEVAKCVTIKITDGGNDSNLTVDFNGTTDDVECKSLREFRGNQVYQIRLKGSYVKF